VKVLGVDERSADLMFRVYRWIRLAGVGDERPFSSLRRTVEHEALVSAMAEREGVRTPSIVAPVALEDGSMALVYELVAGRSLDKVDPSEWSESLLPGVLEQVAILRTHRIAHRDLRLANVFLTDEGEPMVIDFGFGEVAAEETLLDQDIAQIVVSSAVRLGANRAVSDAVTVLGPDVVARAAPRMQPLALAGATQSALKKNKKLLDEVYSEVVERTSLDRVEPVKIERVRPRTLIMTALIFGAVWILIPQFADLPRILQQVRGADWSWAIPAIVFSMLTYVGAAMALSVSVPHRLSVARSTLVTLGGSFVNRISPAKVGGIALNLRYLQKQGNDTAVAASSVALYQGVGAVVHLSLLLVFGIWAGRTVSFTEFLPSGTIIFIASAAILVIIGILIAIPKVRVAFHTYVRPQLSSIRANFVSLLHSPGRFVVMVVGSAILTLSYIGALWESIQAFGG
jgi:undecaprenyl-diphosphatase